MRKTSSLIGILAALSLFVVVAVLDACSSSNVGTSGAAVTGAAAGQACVADKDCQAGLDCAHGTCVADDNDVQGEDGDDQGVDDDHSSTMPAGQGDGDDDADQGEDGATGQACKVSTDCAAGQECDDGMCKVQGGH